MLNLTERSKKVLAIAHEEAERAGEQYVGVEHLLRAIIREAQHDPTGPVAGMIRAWQDQRFTALPVQSQMTSGS